MLVDVQRWGEKGGPSRNHENSAQNLLLSGSTFLQERFFVSKKAASRGHFLIYGHKKSLKVNYHSKSKVQLRVLLSESWVLHQKHSYISETQNIFWGLGFNSLKNIQLSPDLQFLIIFRSHRCKYKPNIIQNCKPAENWGFFTQLTNAKETLVQDDFDDPTICVTASKCEVSLKSELRFAPTATIACRSSPPVVSCSQLAPLPLFRVSTRRGLFDGNGFKPAVEEEDLNGVKNEQQ